MIAKTKFSMTFSIKKKKTNEKQYKINMFNWKTRFISYPENNFCYKLLNTIPKIFCMMYLALSVTEESSENSMHAVVDSYE